MTLKGKVALVTGASRGIGAGIAQRLAKDGAKVIVNYQTSQEKADGLVATIKAGGGEARAVKADMSNLEEIKVLVEQTIATFGQLDILVNNAGWADFKGLFEITPEHVQKQLDLNVTGLVFATQYAAAHMQEGGRIINISSISAKGGNGGGVYGATKAAVNALTKSFAAELGPKGITVNAIAPGVIETDLYFEAGLDQLKDAIIASTPLGRTGQPSDIAGVAAFLASDDASWMTGEVVQNSGGRLM